MQLYLLDVDKQYMQLAAGWVNNFDYSWLATFAISFIASYKVYIIAN